MDVMQGKHMILVLKRTLDLVDHRLISHGERVAYIVYDMLRASGADTKTIIDVCIMALLHDIGAYKTEEIDRLLEFETKNVSNHAIYGYLYLRNLLPKSELAEMILYHHMPYRTLQAIPDNGYHRFANMIHLADRIDIYVRSHKKLDDTYLDFLQRKLINPELIALFIEANKKYDTLAHLHSGKYENIMFTLSEKIHFTKEEMIQYLQLISFSIDFRSEHTVNHTILVVELATQLARLMNLPNEKIEKVRLGALLHDIGKIATPLSILEKPGPLTKDETVIMKQHVAMTRTILEGYIDEEVCRIAYRHHERLNGKGYPEGLQEEDLTVPEQIMAVADITSALLGKRSYKNPYPKSEIINILNNLVKNRDIQKDIAFVMIENFNQICETVFINAKGLTSKYENMNEEFVRYHHWYETLKE